MMRKEMDDQDELRHLDLKNLLFATGPNTSDPQMFYRLYPEDFGLTEEDEDMIEWETPQTVGEAERMLDELRALGTVG
jgi:hypothetical protein